MEIDNHFDGSLVSRVHIHRLLHAEPPHLGARSSGAGPFITVFAQLVLWFGFSVPLVFLGAYFAVRRTGGAPSANQLYSTSNSKATVRDVPRFLFFVSGIVPFLCCVHVVVLHRVIPVAASVLLILRLLTSSVAILAITCSKMSITLKYFQLFQPLLH